VRSGSTLARAGEMPRSWRGGAGPDVGRVSSKIWQEFPFFNNRVNGFTYPLADLSQHSWGLLWRKRTPSNQLLLLTRRSSPSRRLSSRALHPTMDCSSRKLYRLCHRIGRLNGSNSRSKSSLSKSSPCISPQPRFLPPTLRKSSRNPMRHSECSALLRQ
jgi:hypothetical protein